MDRDALKTVRRIELLARLELLDKKLDEQARRAAFVRERGWDATNYDIRSKLLRETRERHISLLRELLAIDPARASDPPDDGKAS